MKKEKKNKHFIKKPFYEGGISAMKAFIKKHLVYPEVARDQQVEGTVYVRYSINYKGNVIDTKIISGIGYGCDEEAARLVNLLTFQVPKNRKIKAIFHKDIQIHFRLPKSTPPPAVTDIQYNYTTTHKENNPVEKKDQKGGGSYEITIQF